MTASEKRLRKALEEALRYIKLDGHHAGAWHNDPHAWRIVTEVIEPALNGKEH